MSLRMMPSVPVGAALTRPPKRQSSDIGRKCSQGYRPARAASPEEPTTPGTTEGAPPRMTPGPTRVSREPSGRQLTFTASLMSPYSLIKG